MVLLIRFSSAKILIGATKKLRLHSINGSCEPIKTNGCLTAQLSTHRIYQTHIKTKTTFATISTQIAVTMVCCEESCCGQKKETKIFFCGLTHTSHSFRSRGPC